MDEVGFVVVTCPDCGPVPVEIDRFEVHADADDGIALYAFTCPGCREVGTGGCRDMIAHLLESGVRRRRLRATGSAPIRDAEVAAFRRWLDTDPVWDLSDDI